ncbi:MAG TPA: hypothetical protein VH333_08640 [Pseudonocardiaceae bacterium]|jgi:hypothetical protein|nr:hypothetical protein [Pseudonocardiaceae bacterium]
MRKPIVLGALVAALFAVTPTASASPSIPTCLISNGGSGGHFSKTLICVELVQSDHGHTGSGSYSPGDANTEHWLTESVEFRPLGPGSSVWLPLATASAHGIGRLTAVTAPVRLPAPGALRACTQVGTGVHTQVGELCSNPA